MPFPHEKLEVYQEMLLYVAWVARVLTPQLKGKDGPTSNQINRAAKSIGANLAEGVGRYLPGNKVQFYRYAQGSTAECASHMAMLKAAGHADETLAGWTEALVRLDRMGKMIQGLIAQAEARAARGG